jgi:hypothetical protein
MKTVNDAILMLRETADQLEELQNRKLELPAEGLSLAKAIESLQQVIGDNHFELRLMVGRYSCSDGPYVKWELYDSTFVVSDQKKSIIERPQLLQIINACIEAHRPAPPPEQSLAQAQESLDLSAQPEF